MPTHHLRVLPGRRGALLTHPSDSVNPDMIGDDVAAEDGELRHFDAEDAFLDMKVS